jgi:hypothetical protein
VLSFLDPLSTATDNILTLEQILIIDDTSDISVSTWSQWGQLSADQLQKVKFLRSNSPKGRIRAKNSAVSYLEEKYQTILPQSMIVFADVAVVATPRWLLALAATLHKVITSLLLYLCLKNKLFLSLFTHIY